MKVALVHEFLNQFGGGERVLEAIHELWPEAPVFTVLHDPNKLGQRFAGWDVRTPRATQLPLVNKFHKWLTFLYPLYFENLDLSEYDIVISSSSSFAKGVITSPDQLHISYIHTPPRFLYGYPMEISRHDKWYWKPILGPIDHFLRIWDFNAAQRPDFLVANSKVTARRIKKFYGREATVIYPPTPSLPAGKAGLRRAGPPVDVGGDKGDRGDKGEYLLVVARLSRYKNVDLAIEACGQLNLPLRVVGTGKEEESLRRLAAKYSNVEMLGFVSDEELSRLYANCRALISPVSDEEFGIVAVEAMAHGKPVVALRGGGMDETVIDGKTGLFFDRPEADSLVEALKEFEKSTFKAVDCVQQAKKFSKERFKREFREFVEAQIKKRQG